VIQHDDASGKLPRQRGTISRIYEVIGIDDGGDPYVRRSVRRVLSQVIRFITHYAEALKREKRAQAKKPLRTD
jgi:hypothetical protein